MTNGEVLKVMWPDVEFEDDRDIGFIKCYFSNSKYLIKVDKDWLKEKYTIPNIVLQED